MILNNISFTVFWSINASLVSKTDFFQKHLGILTKKKKTLIDPQTSER